VITTWQLLEPESSDPRADPSAAQRSTITSDHSNTALTWANDFACHPGGDQGVVKHSSDLAAVVAVDHVRAQYPWSPPLVSALRCDHLNGYKTGEPY